MGIHKHSEQVMEFGEKLKKMRQDKGLTQPDLAEVMGIEQSYLSKLENGKSLPSNDMLNRILDVFGVTIAELIDDLDQGVRNQLRQIPDVAEHLSDQRERSVSARRRWIIVSTAMLTFGIGLTFAGAVNLFYPNIAYHYQSTGVVLDGESKEIFRDPENSVSRDATRQEVTAAIDAINARVDEAYLQSSTFRGSTFNVPVDGGSRTYFLQSEADIDPWQNKAIAVLGMMLLVSGTLGLGFQNKVYP